jgi:hypothetical protein
MAFRDAREALMIHGSQRAVPPAFDYRRDDTGEQAGSAPTLSLAEIGRLMYTNELSVEERLSTLRRAYDDLSRQPASAFGDADPAALLVEMTEAIGRLRYSVMHNCFGTVLDFEPGQGRTSTPYDELLAELHLDDPFELAAWDEDEDKEVDEEEEDFDDEQGLH